jgi:release factor glutamine methyltransferase
MSINRGDFERRCCTEMIEKVSFFAWYDRARQQAIAANVPLLELDWLVLHLTQLDRLSLRLRSISQTPPQATPQTTKPTAILACIPLSEFDQRWQQRCLDRVPVQYLAGFTTWRSFELRVTPDVLIPRPETEAIIDLAIEAVGDRLDGHWVDLGTGSGAIAIGLARELEARQAIATVHASDTSAAALAIARQNAADCGVADRLQFHQGSWFEPFRDRDPGFSFRALVSNPPYIPAATVDQLAPEVRDREPRLALDGGDTGFDCLSVLIEQAPHWLERDGIWIVEHEASQGAELRDQLRQRGYREVRTVCDLAGLDRFAIARAPL